jgi:hypothetical protein
MKRCHTKNCHKFVVEVNHRRKVGWQVKFGHNKIGEKAEPRVKVMRLFD